MNEEDLFKNENLVPIQNSGKGIRPEKDPLKRWDGWETAPEFLRNMVKNSKDPVQMKGFMEQVIREINMTPKEQRTYLRPDAISEDYKQNYRALLNAEPKLNANPTGLTIDQILANDRHFHRTYVNHNIFAQIMAKYGLTSYLDSKKWEIKHHLLTDYGDPTFTNTFQNLGYLNVGPEGVKSEGYGWGQRYEIPFTVIDQAAGGTYDPDYWHQFFIAQHMGIFGDERGWLGGQGRTTTGRGAPNLKGLVNWADAGGNVRTGLTSPAADYGFSDGKADFEDNWMDMLASWQTYRVFGANWRNFVYISTPGIAAQTYIDDSAVGDLKTLYQQLQHKWFLNGEISSWYRTENITSVALASLSTATQRYVGIIADPMYIQRKVVYPLQRKILSDKFKTYPDDIAFAYITGDILQVYDRRAIISAGSSFGTHCKSELVGWGANGLFMDGNTKGVRAYQAAQE